MSSGLLHGHAAAHGFFGRDEGCSTTGGRAVAVRVAGKIDRPVSVSFNHRYNLFGKFSFLYQLIVLRSADRHSERVRPSRVARKDMGTFRSHDISSQCE